MQLEREKGLSGGLEGIADGEVEGKTFAKGVHVVESSALGLVGRMEPDAEIEAEDEELHVVAQTETSTDSHTMEVVETEF